MRSLDIAWERANILNDWKKWSVKIREVANEILSSDLLGVYVFGSAITGRLVASSDIDILVVAKNLPKSAIKRSEIKGRIIDKAGLPLIHPFEIHLVDEEEAKVYFRHIHRSLSNYNCLTPGFGLAVNVPAIFIGTLIIALMIPVLFFLFANFPSGLSKLRKEVFGQSLL